MNDRAFDRLIRNSLKEWKSGTKPDWQRLESQIDSWQQEDETASNVAFDKVLREKLAESRVNYPNDSWERMERFLAFRKHAGRQLIMSQVAGTVILFLVLLLLLQWGSHHPSVVNDVPIVSVEKPDNTSSGAENPSEKETSPALENAKENFGGTVLKDPGLVIGAPGNPLSTKNRKTPGTLQNQKGERKYAGTESVSEPLTQSVPDTDQTLLDHQQPGLEKNKSIPIGLILPVRECNGLLWNVEKVQDPVPPPTLMNPENQEIAIESKPETHWSIGLAATPSILFVRSPYDEWLQQPGYNRTVFSPGFLFSVGFGFGSWQIETGTGWKTLSYHPRHAEEWIASEKVAIYLDKIHFDFLTFPLQVNRQFQWTDCFQAYLTAGLNARVTLYSEYTIHRKEQGLVSLINDLKINPAYKNSITGQKEYLEGVMEGGNPTANVGLESYVGGGINFCLRNDTFFFSDIRLGMNLLPGGIGPNNDTYYMVQLATGIKVIL